jgi:DNA repair exonuclease SbcCD ATPase subunit
MAKALLGQRAFQDDRLVLEAARLRTRVRDLETLIEHLQHDNDRLRDDLRTQDLQEELEPVPEPVS